MTQAMNIHGKSIRFPVAYDVDESGMIPTPQSADIEVLAATVRDDDLLIFAKRLVDKARKQRFKPKYQLVNPARIQLAMRCLDRAIRDGVTEPTDNSEPDEARPV